VKLVSLALIKGAVPLPLPPQRLGVRIRPEGGGGKAAEARARFTATTGITAMTMGHQP